MSKTQHISGWRLLRWLLITWSSLAFLGYSVLALGTVPAPSAETAIEVSGHVALITAPHPEYGDLHIFLEDGRQFYVNRASELSYFDWEGFLTEVQPGDEVRLTAVSTLADRWFSLGGALLPVAGVETATKTYMDPAISAKDWTYQADFMRYALLAGSLLFAVVLISVAYRPSPPSQATA